MTENKLDFGQLMEMDVSSLGLTYCRFFRDTFGFPPDVKSIATTKEGLIRQFHQAEEAAEQDERFNQIVKIMLANLVLDVKYFARDATSCSDVSELCGEIGTLLAGANLRGCDVEEFAEEFERRFRMGKFSPAIDKIKSERDGVIASVVDSAMATARRLDAKVTAETANDLIDIAMKGADASIIQAIGDKSEAIEQLLNASILPTPAKKRTP